VRALARIIRAMRFSPILAALLLFACASHKSSSGFGSDSNDGTSGGSGSPGPSLGGDNGGSGTDCSEAAKLVYVVSAQDDLYSFQPAHLMFVRIGTLVCPTQGPSHPFSMAVDRTGIAWVNYDDGELFKVSTADASCTKTSYTPQQGFTTFGMGFSTNAAGQKDETLFICGFRFDNGAESSVGLGRLDTSSLAVTPLGDFTGGIKGHCGELTGTGDAKLYGFFPGSPAQLAAIDKTSTATPSPTALSGLPLQTTAAYAFSFWGGDFWFYTSAGASDFSQVTQFKASSDQSVKVVRSNVGFTIVGAGVSTCAPTSPPK
jgi:hypothetical protein